MKDISSQDIAMFVLTALISVALSSFAFNINAHIESVALEGQQAQVLNVSNTSAPSAPSVVLVANPGIVSEGEVTSLVWTVSSPNFVDCSASSEPEDSTWQGSVASAPGTHTHITNVLNEVTDYTITCTETDGNTSVSTMTVAVE
jgi:hypothetical protein